MLYSISLFTLAALFLFFEMALQVSPGIMTNNLMYSLHIDIFWLGITSGAYFITYTIMQIPAGIFYDKFPPRKVIMAPLITCILGGILFAIAPSFYIAAFARILMGFGSAFAFIGVLVVASHVFNKKYFTVIAGVTQMLASLGAMCGTIPLIPLLNNYGWRATMLIISGIGLILFILMYMFLRLPNNNLSNTRTKVSDALLSIIQNKQTWIIAIYACLLWMPMSVVASLYGIPFVEKYFHLRFNISATIITLMWFGIAIGAPIAGIIADTINKIKIILFSCALIGLISFCFIMLIPINNAYLLGLLFLFCGAACSGQAISFSLISKNNRLEHRATAIGFNNMAVVISGFIFQPLVGFIIRSQQVTDKHPISSYDAHSYHTGMMVILLGFFIATLISLFLIKENSRR